MLGFLTNKHFPDMENRFSVCFLNRSTLQFGSWYNLNITINILSFWIISDFGSYIHVAVDLGTNWNERSLFSTGPNCYVWVCSNSDKLNNL